MPHFHFLKNNSCFFFLMTWQRHHICLTSLLVFCQLMLFLEEILLKLHMVLFLRINFKTRFGDIWHGIRNTECHKNKKDSHESKILKWLRSSYFTEKRRKNRDIAVIETIKKAAGWWLNQTLVLRWLKPIPNLPAEQPESFGDYPSIDHEVGTTERTCKRLQLMRI